MAPGFLYIVVMMDCYGRYVLAWRLSNPMDTSFSSPSKNPGCPTIAPSLTGSTVCYARDARFIIAKAARRGDYGVKVIWNPGMSGKRGDENMGEKER